MARILDTVAGMKAYLGFWLTFLCLTTIGLIAFFKDPSLVLHLPVTLGVYLSSRAAQNISAHLNARHDPSCKTDEIVREAQDR